MKFLEKLFTDAEGSDEHDADHTRRLAAAALLIEVARADDVLETDEETTMRVLLERSLGLSRQESAALLAEANAEVDHATSLYEFTRLLNDHYSLEARSELVVDLWRVAFADSRLDKYEEHIIRRVSDLLYVPHSEFIRGKHIASEEDWDTP